MSMSDTIRIGVYGTAYWAETVHLPALKNAPGFSLAGVFGRNVERCQALASQFDVQVFPDYATFLSSVDAVSFAVPPAAQAELALQAIRAGKHVLVEKPVAPTIEEAEAIGQAVYKAGVGAVCFLTRNFIPELRAFTEAMVADSPVSAHAQFFSSALTPGSPYAGSVWRQGHNASLWDIGPHLVTSLMNLFGPVVSIAATRREGGEFAGRLYHRTGRESAFVMNQRMPLGPLQEALIVETVTGEHRLENLQYDRVGAFRSAAALLQRAIAGEAEAKTAFNAAIDVVRVLAAAERSVEAGGSPETIPSAST